MSEQIASELPKPAGLTKEENNKEREMLWEKYKEAVGVDPMARSLSLEQLQYGIDNPEKERERLKPIDDADDKEELAKLYL